MAQTEVHSGQRPGGSTGEQEEIKEFKAENRRLREDLAILKAATRSFVGSSPPRHESLGRAPVASHRV